MINFRRLAKSFKYAFAGWQKVFWSEQNFRIHNLIALVILILAIFFRIDVLEFIIIVFIIGFIFILEIVNTIFERLLDLIKPRFHSYVQDIKDMTAAIVLIGSLVAVIVGFLIFYPYFLSLII